MAESSSRTQLRKKSSSLTRVSAAQSNTMLIQGSAEKVNIIWLITYMYAMQQTIEIFHSMKKGDLRERV